MVVCGLLMCMLVVVEGTCSESVDCVHACWTSELFRVESFGVYLGTSVVFGYAWFSVMKSCTVHSLQHWLITLP